MKKNEKSQTKETKLNTIRKPTQSHQKGFLSDDGWVLTPFPQYFSHYIEDFLKQKILALMLRIFYKKNYYGLSLHS